MMKKWLFGSALLSVLLLPWGGHVSATNSCFGCTCKVVLEKIPCGIDLSEASPDALGSAANADVNGGAFVCWHEGEQPAEVSEICGNYCDSLPTPPPSPCIDNEQIITHYVLEQRIGPCESFCPPDESGACDDGINNDAYLDEVTDCADPDCAGDAVCRAAAPATSNLGLGLILVALLSLGMFRLIRAARSD